MKQVTSTINKQISTQSRRKPFEATKTRFSSSTENNKIKQRKSLRKQVANDFAPIFAGYCEEDPSWKDEFWKFFHSKKYVSVDSDWALRPLSHEGYKLLENSNFNVMYLEARNISSLDKFLKVVDEMLVHRQKNVRVLREYFDKKMEEFDKHDLLFRLKNCKRIPAVQVPFTTDQITSYHLRFLLTRFKNFEVVFTKKDFKPKITLQIENKDQLTVKSRSKPVFQIQTVSGVSVTQKKSRVFSLNIVERIEFRRDEDAVETRFKERKIAEFTANTVVERMKDLTIEGKIKELSACNFGFSVVREEKERVLAIEQTSVDIVSSRNSRRTEEILEIEEIVAEVEIIGKKRRRKRSKKAEVEISETDE